MYQRNWLFLLSAVLVSTVWVEQADACGGFFCNAARPVNQAAERIIFAKNSDGTVTAAIEIMYSGPGEEFAWVLPVPPGETQVGVSSGLALDRLEQQSNPQYQLNVSIDGSCVSATNAPGGGRLQLDASPAPIVAEAPGPQIVVVAEGSAGPYDWTQIAVSPEFDDPADAAVMWLEDNSYDVGDLGPDVLREYLMDGMDLIAFRLQKGKASGSIRPIMLTYEAERPFIPIKPTAIAADDDMGMKIWVLGESRAIPNNYFHLELNEAMIDWFNPQQNYDDVVIAAGDEAGGQGFVTEQSGPAGEFAESIYLEWEQEQWQTLRTGRFDSLASFLEAAQISLGAFDGFNDVMLDPEVIPLREGATHEQFLACIRCYFEQDVPVLNQSYPETPYLGADDPIHLLDVEDFLQTLYTFVVEPMELTRQLFEDHAAVTRFYTTMSPDEMTLDPDFDFNPELPDVGNVHVAEQRLRCDAETDWEITLPQGQIVRGNGRTWPVRLGAEMPVNLRVLQLSTGGDGEIVTDNAELVASMLTDLNIGDAMPQLMDPDNGSATDVTPSGAQPGTGAGAGDENAGSNVEGVEASAGGGGCSVGSIARGSGSSPLLAFLGLLGLPLWLGRRRFRANRLCD